MDWGTIFMGYFKDLVWVLFAAIAMAISLIILLKVYDFLTPRIDEQEELKKGNIAVAIVMGSLILAFGFVAGMVLQTGTVVNTTQTESRRQINVTEPGKEEINVVLPQQEPSANEGAVINNEESVIDTDKMTTTEEN